MFAPAGRGNIVRESGRFRRRIATGKNGTFIPPVPDRGAAVAARKATNQRTAEIEKTGQKIPGERVSASSRGSRARGWVTAATAERRSPARRTLRAPSTSAARPKRNDDVKPNALNAATRNPIWSGAGERGGA